MTGGGFHSKSSTIAKKKQIDKAVESYKERVVEKTVEKKSCIFFFGEQDEAYKFGKDLHLDIYDGEKMYSDTSFVVGAGALFVNNVVPGIRLFHAISVAVNHGVPIIWRHSQLAPLKWMWSVTRCYVGTEAVDIGRIWNDILMLMR